MLVNSKIQKLEKEDRKAHAEPADHAGQLYSKIQQLEKADR